MEPIFDKKLYDEFIKRTLKMLNKPQLTDDDASIIHNYINNFEKLSIIEKLSYKTFEMSKEDFEHNQSVLFEVSVIMGLESDKRISALVGVTYQLKDGLIEKSYV